MELNRRHRKVTIHMRSRTMSTSIILTDHIAVGMVEDALAALSAAASAATLPLIRVVVVRVCERREREREKEKEGERERRGKREGDEWAYCDSFMRASVLMEWCR